MLGHERSWGGNRESDLRKDAPRNIAKPTMLIVAKKLIVRPRRPYRSDMNELASETARLIKMGVSI